MAYDEALARRIRMFLPEHSSVTEMKMFGGLGFLVDGNMAVAASSSGGLLVRVDPEESAALAEGELVKPMVMRGRAMTGWLQVAPEALTEDATVKGWVERGVRFAKALPPK